MVGFPSPLLHGPEENPLEIPILRKFISKKHNTRAISLLLRWKKEPRRKRASRRFYLFYYASKSPRERRVTKLEFFRRPSIMPDFSKRAYATNTHVAILFRHSVLIAARQQALTIFDPQSSGKNARVFRSRSLREETANRHFFLLSPLYIPMMPRA